MMGFSKQQQQLLGLVILLALQTHSNEAAVFNKSPKIKPEVTKQHLQAYTDHVLDNNLVSNKIEVIKNPFRQIIAQSYKRSDKKSDNVFSVLNSQANGSQPYKERRHTEISGNYTHSFVNSPTFKTSFQARQQSKRKDSLVSILFDLIHYPQQPSTQKMGPFQNIILQKMVIHKDITPQKKTLYKDKTQHEMTLHKDITQQKIALHKDSTHKWLPALQPKLRFIRDARQANNKTNDEDNILTVNDSRTNETTKLTDLLLTNQSNYIVLEYHKSSKTNKAVRHLHKDKDINSSSDLSNSTENTTTMTHLLQKDDNNKLDDINTSITTTAIDIKDSDTSINFDVFNTTNTTNTIDSLLTNQYTSTNYSNTITNTHIPYEPTIQNAINQEDTSNDMTTQFSNVIPQGPFNRDLPEHTEPYAATETSSSPQTTTNVSMALMDSTNFIDTSTITNTTTTQAHDNHDQVREEQAHTHDPVSEEQGHTHDPVSEGQTHTHDQFSEEQAHTYDQQNIHQTSPTNIKLDQTTNFNESSHNRDNFTHPKHLAAIRGNTDKKDEASDSLNDIFLKISLSSSGDSMMVNWLAETNFTQISGFQVSYRMNDREDFDSSSLGSSVRSFALHSLHEDEDYVICVHALVNNTVVKDSCAEWSKSSMKMIIGILAGVIFLFPCIAVMVWILYKDYKVKQKASFQKLTDENNVCEDHISFTKAKHNHHSHEQHKNGKLAVVVEDDKAIVVFSHESSNNHHQDAGHENPCGSAAYESTDDEARNGP